MSAAPDTVCVPAFTQSQTIFILSAAHFFMIGFQHEIKIDLIYFDTFPDLIMHNSFSLRYSKEEKIFLHYLSSNVITYSDIPFQLMSPRLCRPEFDHIIPNHFHEIS